MKLKNIRVILFTILMVATLSACFLQGEAIKTTATKEEISEITTPALSPEVSIPPEKEKTPEKEVIAATPIENKAQEIQETPVPATPIPTPTADEGLYCTLSVRCDTILDNLSALSPEKLQLIPENGVIFPEQQVVFYPGESVFNLLSREMKKNKIHLEFVRTPAYDSMYIEGIGNLYQFDCGELSGWIYQVNGESSSIGCSLYELKSGDKVEFLYTCDLGNDL